MTTTYTYKDYAAFSFEDFLQDDFFISSVKEPTTDSVAFWTQFEKENERLQPYHAAKDFIESVHLYQSVLSPDEKKEMKKTIHRKYNAGKLRRRLAYISISTAAVLLLGLGIFYFSRLGNTSGTGQVTDILTFAEQTVSDAIQDAKDVQLMLSDNQVIHLKQEETVITYDTTSIVVDKKAIAQDKMSSFNQLVVPVGKRSVLNLSDGTKVWVNSGTRVIYPVSFEEKERVVFVDGEIYLEVAEDKKRPFIVKTKSLDVQVLGTRFNVTAYDADEEKTVVLVSGSVQVNTPNDKNKTRLLPKQRYVSKADAGYIEMVDPQKYIAWIDGLYYCEDTNLHSIFQRLSRYYGVEITCAPSIGNELFSGKLDLKENLTEIFDGIAFTIPITYTEKDGKFMIHPFE